MKILVAAATYDEITRAPCPSLLVNRGSPIVLGQRVVLRDDETHRTWRGIVVRMEEENGRKRLHLARGTGEMLVVVVPPTKEG